tara:strand:- start:77 stop:448 length:372 start_codon:yes stop_codon:yes gene_type:complete
MSSDFIAQAQALKDENERLREALSITSEALEKVKQIVDGLLNPASLTPPANLGKEQAEWDTRESKPHYTQSPQFDHSNTPQAPPVVEQPQTDPDQYRVTKHGGDEQPHSGPYKVDVSGYFQQG